MANDFFGELGKHFSDAANTAASKTNEFFETQKLTAQISGEQRSLEKLYQAIGEDVYKKGNPPQEFKELFAEVKLHSDRIDTLKKSIAELKGQKICPSCGAAVDADNAFCPKCGTAIPTDAEKKPEKTAEPSGEPDGAEENTGDKIFDKADEMHDEVVEALNKAKDTVREEASQLKDEFTKKDDE